MALKQIVFTSTYGRDNGKKFHIKEMPSRQAEKWAARAGLVLMRNDTDVGSNFGWAQLSLSSFQALQNMTFAEVEPLMDEMMTCVTFEPSPGVVRPLVDQLEDGNDIEELMTRFKLREAIFRLHADFFLNAGTSKPD